MKPYVVCHMMSSVDGRIKQNNWNLRNSSKLFEDSASKIKVDAWIVGRTTMQEFCSKKRHRKLKSGNNIPRTDFVGAHRAKTFAVAIDPSGKCYWDSNMVDTEHVIEVLTEKISGQYLNHLREKNVSYIFGGKSTLDLSVVLEKLNRLFAIRRVRIDGGGTVNGSFLNSNLIDEFSHIVVPLIDGTIASTAVFDVDGGKNDRVATSMKLKSVKRLRGGVLWCRYRILKR